MKIYINDKYAITSDPYQFFVCTRGVHKSDQKVEGNKEGYKAGDEHLKPIASLHTLEQCFKDLLTRQIRESPAVGFKEIMLEVERIEKELKEAIKI